jgi:ketopantoate reductase
MTVNGKQVAVPVIHPDEVTEPAHLILVALKHHHLHGALQDIEAGRKTEVDIFGGKVVAMGAKYQVMTPVNETILRIIKVIESN